MSRIALIGKKIGMTNLFNNGIIVPVTLIKIEPNIVNRIQDYGDSKGLVLEANFGKNKTEIGSDKKNNKNCNKNITVKEFRISNKLNVPVGVKMVVGDYLNNATVDVRSTSIGKGFQGAMKRWGFGGLPASHGVSLTHRSLGSTGNRTLPGRVFKGKKMAGHMGNESVCTQNMQICCVDLENNIVAVRGSVPGKKNTIVYITNAIKKYVANDDNVINGVACEG